jgi:hypothetical protein
MNLTNSKNINKTYIGFKNKNNDAELHNNIYNHFLYNVKNNIMLSENFFKILLPIYYKKIFNKTIIYKNIKYDITLKENILSLLFDYSFIQLYNIINHFIIDEIIDVEKLTAMFFATLYFITNDLNILNETNN